MARVERARRSPASSRRATADMSRRPRRHRAQPPVPDDPGLPRLRNFVGGTLRLAIPAIMLGLPPRHLHRPWPARRCGLDPRPRHDLRGVLPGRAAGHGDLLDVVRHPASAAAAHSRVRGGPHRLRRSSRRRTSARSCGRACSRWRAGRWRRPPRSGSRRPDDALRGPAPGAQEHDPVAGDPVHRALQGHLARLHHRLHGPDQGGPGRQQPRDPPFELYLFIAVVYWVCTYSMSLVARRFERRAA